MDTKRLENKVAIVTGGSSGIGKACALRYVAEGAKVVIGDINVTAGEKLVKEINTSGKKAVFIKTDVTNADDLDALIKCAIDNFGKIDILHCNAGCAVSKYIEDITIADYDKTMILNTKSVFVLCQKALPYLKETKGNILNTASVAAYDAKVMSSIYSASKMAVVKLTEVIALEYAKYGVRANALCLGLTDTDILAGVPQDALAGVCATIPLNRLARAEEQAAAAAFLVSDEAGYITGQALIVDGGLSAH